MLSTQTSIIRNANWTSIPGNSVSYSYFSGVHARNPSANPDNLDTIFYWNGNGILVFSVEYTWDINDRMVNERCI